MRIQNDSSKKKTKKDHHKPKKIIAADRPHPNFRHFMVEKYEIKVYLNLLKLTKYERFCDDTGVIYDVVLLRGVRLILISF